MNFLTPMVVKVISQDFSLVLHIATSGITLINSFDKIRPEQAACR
jgi:hypothetical protein